MTSHLNNEAVDWIYLTRECVSKLINEWTQGGINIAEHSHLALLRRHTKRVRIQIIAWMDLTRLLCVPVWMCTRYLPV